MSMLHAICALVAAYDSNRQVDYYIQTRPEDAHWVDNMKSIIKYFLRQPKKVLTCGHGIISGLPCVSFSTDGKRNGLSNIVVKAVLFDVLNLMLHVLPPFVIIENVYKFIWRWFVKRVRNFACNIYRITTKVFDAQYFGSAQRLRRRFRVMVRSKLMLADCVWPEAAATPMSLTSFILSCRTEGLWKPAKRHQFELLTRPQFIRGSTIVLVPGVLSFLLEWMRASHPTFPLVKNCLQKEKSLCIFTR